MRTGPDTVSWRAAGGADRNDRSSARKVKILTTIPKGTSRNLFEDFTTGKELDQLHDYLQAKKQRNDWTPCMTPRRLDVV